MDYIKLISDLDRLLKTLPSDPPLPKGINGAHLKRLRADLRAAILRLETLSRRLDPIQQPPTVFDPYDTNRIGEMIAGALVLQPLHPLGSVPRFYGSGVYALYYKGRFDAYRPISKKNHPIYVGKSDPKDAQAKTVEDQGDRLSIRLAEHAKSITLARKNLKIDDFDCRYLVIVSGFQKPAEDHLILKYKPIWNNEMKICFGFGKHGDDAKTRGNKRSPWDTLHPGRLWAAGNHPSRAVGRIKVDIAEHFTKFPPESE